MRPIIKIYMISVILSFLVGCAAQKPPKVWQSLPTVQRTTMKFFEIQIEPLKLDNPFFVAFELAVNNTSSAPLEINWNKSRYLHQGQEKGIFVFRGIDPQAIRNRTIPNEIVPAGNKIAKRISPARTVAWLPRDQLPEPGQRGFTPGILPSGDNSVSLVLSQSGKEWRQALTIKIVAK